MLVGLLSFGCVNDVCPCWLVLWLNVMVLVVVIAVGCCLRDCVAYVRLLVFATCLLGLHILVVGCFFDCDYCGGFVNSVG